MAILFSDFKSKSLYFTLDIFSEVYLLVMRLEYCQKQDVNKIDLRAASCSGVIITQFE